MLADIVEFFEALELSLFVVYCPSFDVRGELVINLTAPTTTANIACLTHIYILN